MIIKVPYGKERINVEIDEHSVSGIVEPNEVPVGDELAVIQNAIKNPVNSKNLPDFLAESKNVLFIVNDATRPTPTAKVLEAIYDYIKDLDIKFIIATGIHRAPTEDEYIKIFGKYYNMFKDNIFVHDSRSEKDVAYLGKSRRGTEIYLNKLCIDAHKIVTIGSVEPHYFAGYTGGRKSFLPGIASYKTIQQNHKLALSPKSKVLKLEGNPVHEDMLDALKTIKKGIFSIQLVLDKNHKIYAATAGNINDAFMEATSKANEIFLVKIKEKADIVVSAMKPPKDMDLYQAQKGIENAKLALKKDGILILVSKCQSGVGEESFVNLLRSSNSPGEALKKKEDEYVLGYHKAIKIAEIMLWAQVWGVTELPPKLLEDMFIKPFNSLQGALDSAIKIKGPDAKILFLQASNLTVPILEKGF